MDSAVNLAPTQALGKDRAPVTPRSATAAERARGPLPSGTFMCTEAACRRAASGAIGAPTITGGDRTESFQRRRRDGGAVKFYFVRSKYLRQIMWMSERMLEADHQVLHHMLSDSKWDFDGLVSETSRQVNTLLGGLKAALLIDESAFAKKSEASAGVARQWNGRLGKV